MLHAPITETKTKPEVGKSLTPGPELHPGFVGLAGRYPAAPRDQSLINLQSAYGNQAVLRSLKSTAPTVSGALLQRKCACGGTPGPTGECPECRAKRLQRQATNQSTVSTAPPIVHQVLRSPGQPLDVATRTLMEPRLGYDFRQVRVHMGGEAAESAQAVNAQAFTVGQNIVFGNGQYAPETVEGRRLIAHELTHVIQQGAGQGQGELKVGEQASIYEKEAERVARSLESKSTSQQPALRTGISALHLQREVLSEEDLTELDVEEETEDDADEVYDGDSEVEIGAETTVAEDEESELTGTLSAEDMGLLAAGPEPAPGETIPMQAGNQPSKDKPKSPPPVKKTTPRKITRIDVDQAAQTMTLTWSDGTKEGPRPISTGKGRPNTKDDPCKTQTEKNCTPNGEFKIGSLGDADTKNSHGDRMSWYAGFVDGRGIGIHDSQPVPGTPASHGCVRVGNSKADDAFAKKINNNVVPGSTIVHVFGKAATKPYKKATPKPKKKK